MVKQHLSAIFTLRFFFRILKDFDVMGHSQINPAILGSALVRGKLLNRIKCRAEP
jgi:hypothetical protein